MSTLPRPGMTFRVFTLFALFAATAGEIVADPVAPIPLSRVRLLDGPFRASMLVNRKVLDEIGVERALYAFRFNAFRFNAFRFNAGLPTRDAKPLDSWASPEPGGAFPGFYEDHYFSATALLFAQTGDPELKKRVDYMVDELANRWQQREHILDKFHAGGDFTEHANTLKDFRSNTRG